MIVGKVVGRLLESCWGVVGGLLGGCWRVVGGLLKIFGGC